MTFIVIFFSLNETWNHNDFEKLNIFLGNNNIFSDHRDFIVVMSTLIQTICLWDKKKDIPGKMKEEQEKNH